MKYIITTSTEQAILKTIDFVAVVRGPCEVVIAQSAPDMLRWARRDQPNLAIWDLEFNDQAKRSKLLSQWHEDPRLRPIPLLLLAPAGDGSLPPLPSDVTCLTKPVDLLELGLHIGALLNHESKAPAPLGGHRRQVGDLVLDYQLFQAIVKERAISLTPTEFKLLRHFVENPGQTFSGEQLLDEVWQYPPGIGSPDVVRMYVKRLRDKIEPDTRNPRYIVTIPGHGYQMPMPAASHYSTSDLLPVSRDEEITDRHHEAMIPLTAIDDTLQEILCALQTVTLTCQATLRTMARLVDKLSQDGDNWQLTRPITAQESSSAVHAGTSPIPCRGDGLNSPAEKIAVATRSLSRLAAELQAPLTQLQESCPTSMPLISAMRSYEEERQEMR